LRVDLLAHVHGGDDENLMADVIEGQQAGSKNISTQSGSFRSSFRFLRQLL